VITLLANGQKLEGVELVIFDKDGTLFQLYPFCSNMVFRRAKAVCDLLGGGDDGLYDWLVDLMGVDVANERIYPQGPIGVFSRYYAQELVNERLAARGYDIAIGQIRAAFERADLLINSEEDMRRSVLPVPGMIELVKSLKGKCKCAILSNDVTPRLVATVRRFGIEDSFDLIVGGDLVAKHKPDPAGALMIMERLGAGPEITALIGDSAPDLEMGARAGCRHLLAVRSDISSAEIILRTGAVAIDDFLDIEIIF
jgi:phosphoglycolate phosphatase